MTANIPVMSRQFLTIPNFPRPVQQLNVRLVLQVSQTCVNLYCQLEGTLEAIMWGSQNRGLTVFLCVEVIFT
jgi:hypothetical protein